MPIHPLFIANISPVQNIKALVATKLPISEAGEFSGSEVSLALRPEQEDIDGLSISPVTLGIMSLDTLPLEVSILVVFIYMN